MAEEYHTLVTSGGLHPAEVSKRMFDTVRKGFDPQEVRTFLERVASELERVAGREVELRQRLADAERRAANPQLDDETLTRALGQETARVLASARQAANDVRARAEENAARSLREAHEEGGRIKAAAEKVLGERTREADAAARQIVETARSEARALAEQAEAQRTKEAEASRAEREELVREARDLRVKVLSDLARRRRVLHLQIERLRAARESLLEAARQSKGVFDSLEEGLSRAEADARLAADAAVRKAEAEPETGVEDLEAVLAVSRQGKAAPPAAEGGGEAAQPEGGEAAQPQAEAVTRPEADAPAQPEAARAPKPEAAKPEAEAHEEVVETVRLLIPPGPTPPARPRPEPRPEEPAAPEAAAEKVAPEKEPESAAPAEPGAPAQPAAGVDDLFARIRAIQPEDAEAGGEGEVGEVGENGEQPESGDEEVDAGEVAAEFPAAAEAAEKSGEVAATASEHLLQQRDQALEPLAGNLSRKLKRALQDDQNALLDRLRSQGPKKGVELLGEDKRRHEHLSQVASSYLEEAVTAGLAFASAGRAAMEAPPGRPGATAAERAGTEAAAGGNSAAPGKGPRGASATRDECQEAGREQAQELAVALTSALRRRLEDVLGAPDLDEQIAVQRVSAAYREWKGRRIERLAGDHLTAAFALGVLGASSEGTDLTWVVDDEGAPCPDCDDNALASPLGPGAPWPTGQTHPPAHPGCRCLLAPARP